MEKNLIDLVEDFKQELIRLDYAKSTQKNYHYVLNVLMKYAFKNSIDYFSDEICIRFLTDVYGITDPISFKQLRQSERNKVRTIRRLSEFLKYGTIIKTHIQMRVPLVSSRLYQEQLLNFRTYCKEEKQYTDKVVLNYERFIERFLGFLEKVNIYFLLDINIEIIEVYTATLSEYTRGTITYHLSALRVFMEYLFVSELHPSNLRNKIPLPAQKNWQIYLQFGKKKMYRNY